MTMSSQIEHLIMASVLTDLDFGRKYIPHLRPVYFSPVAGAAILMDVASKLVTNYDSALSLEQVDIELKNRRGDPEKIQDARELAADLYELAKEPPPNGWWSDRWSACLVQRSPVPLSSHSRTTRRRTSPIRSSDRNRGSQTMVLDFRPPSISRSSRARSSAAECPGSSKG